VIARSGERRRSGWPSRLAQAFVLLSIGALIWFLVDTTVDNLQARGISTGFGFLWRVTSLPIPNTWLAYTAGTSTYGRAIAIGLLNTITVSVLVIVLATVLGTIIGVARLSSSWLMSRAAGAYVEAMRNVPVLLHLLFWYQLLLKLPGPRRAFNPFTGVFISNRGIRYPSLEPDAALVWALVALTTGAIIAALLTRANRMHAERIGRRRRIWPLALLCIVLPPLAVWQLTDAALTVVMPELAGFDIRGGGAMTPELSALVIGLTTYASAFVAEIVRAGIQGVPRGQREAASALGLRMAPTLRLVVLPQALRIIVPPLTSEYLGIIKNSSLAVAVGYPDLVAIVNSTMSDTGQAIEGVAIIMLAFLAISLALSLFMNWYNARVVLTAGRPP
jgi:general L-amino acid transport system permease protein